MTLQMWLSAAIELGLFATALVFLFITALPAQLPDAKTVGAVALQVEKDKRNDVAGRMMRHSLALSIILSPYVFLMKQGESDLKIIVICGAIGLVLGGGLWLLLSGSMKGLKGWLSSLPFTDYDRHQIFRTRMIFGGIFVILFFMKATLLFA